VQTEADSATQELGVEEAANNLDANRRGLLRLLAFDLNTPIRASDALGAKRVDLNVAQALRVALENQPEYLMQLISSEHGPAIAAVAAKIEVAASSFGNNFMDYSLRLVSQWCFSALGAIHWFVVGFARIAFRSGSWGLCLYPLLGGFDS